MHFDPFLSNGREDLTRWWFYVAPVSSACAHRSPSLLALKTAVHKRPRWRTFDTPKTWNTHAIARVHLGQSRAPAKTECRPALAGRKIPVTRQTKEETLVTSHLGETLCFQTLNKIYALAGSKPTARAKYSCEVRPRACSCSFRSVMLPSDRAWRLSVSACLNIRSAY